MAHRKEGRLAFPLLPYEPLCVPDVRDMEFWQEIQHDAWALYLLYKIPWRLQSQSAAWTPTCAWPTDAMGAEETLVQ